MTGHHGQAPSRTALRRVDMRNDYDCGVACLAMLTCLTPDEIKTRLGYSPAETRWPQMPLGLPHEEVILILHQEGRNPLHLRAREDIDEDLATYPAGSPQSFTARTMTRRQMIPDHDELLAMAAGRPAMLAVKRHDSAAGHFVVWDGERVLDPHPERLVEHQGLGIWRVRSAIVVLA